VCPFTKDITLASAALRFFQTKFLQKNKLASMPVFGYNARQNYSFKAMKWLAWVEQTEGVSVRTAFSPGGEHRVMQYLLDGYSDGGGGDDRGESKGRVYYDFHGTYYHGFNASPEMESRRTHAVTAEETRRYEETIIREQRLQEYIARSDPGAEYRVMWEHDFDSMRASNAELDDFCKRLKFHIIDPTEILRGGRTGAVKLLYRAKSPQDRIYYLDVVSLYPYVMATNEYPKSYPKVLYAHQNLSYELDYYDLAVMCVSILPPDAMHIPVLPMNINGKMHFPLCYACAKDECQELCTHTDKERALTGTFISCEVYEAMRQGYRLLTIYNVWWYQSAFQRIPDEEFGFFRGYITSLYKLKQQSSGWPVECKTRKDKSRYLKSVYTDMGIKMAAKEVSDNPPMRNLAKLLLNILWGRLSLQYRGKTRTKLITDEMEKDSLYEDARNIVQQEHFVDENETKLLVVYENVDDGIQHNMRSSLVTSAFVTAYARLTLLKLIQKCGLDLIYFDTDSCIFSSEDPDVLDRFNVGPNIGQLTNELTSKFGAGTYGVSFASPASKVYSLVTNKPGCVITRCKGIARSMGITPETVERLAADEAASTTFKVPFHVEKDRLGNIRETPMDKIIRQNFTNRVKLNAEQTMPYGCKYNYFVKK
jgi:hypothetical protein